MQYGSLHARRLRVSLIIGSAYLLIVCVVVLLWSASLRRLTEPNGYQLYALRHALQWHGLAAGLLVGAFAWARGRRSVPPRLGKLSIAGLWFLLLASGDRLATVAYPPILSGSSIFEPHETRGWTHRAGARARYSNQAIRINAKGLRGREVPYQKPKGEQRVVFLGDSVAFGWGVTVEDCLVWRLERYGAQSGNDRLRVVNCSISGYSPWQEYDLLESEGLKYEPDVVVVAFCLNDVVEKFELTRFGGTGRGKLPPPPALEWSGLFRMFRARFTGVEEARRKETYSVRRLMEEPDAPQILEAWQITLQNLNRIVGLARRRAVSLAIVCFPYPQQLLPEAPDTSPPQQRLAGFAGEADVPFLDLLPVLRAYCRENKLRGPELFLDHNHLTPEGHRVAAEAIYAFLARHELLK